VKKLLIVLFFLCSFSARAGEFDFALGGVFNIHDTFTNLAVVPSIGGEYVKFSMGYFLGSLMGITVHSFSPRINVHIPFTYKFGQNKSFALGPMIDVGPSFSMGGGLKQIDFASVGIGLKTKIFFNEKLGIGVVPVHVTMHFANWTSGDIGTVKNFALSYDVLVSLILRW
jgi:hypothetical protein